MHYALSRAPSSCYYYHQHSKKAKRDLNAPNDCHVDCQWLEYQWKICMTNCQAWSVIVGVSSRASTSHQRSNKAKETWKLQTTATSTVSGSMQARLFHGGKGVLHQHTGQHSDLRMTEFGLLAENVTSLQVGCWSREPSLHRELWSLQVCVCKVRVACTLFRKSLRLMQITTWTSCYRI